MNKIPPWIWKALGAAAIVGGLLWFHQNVLDLSPSTIQAWMLSLGWAAPVIYIALYTLRPLILFPASLLSVAGGLAFGPLWGTVYTIAGAVMGAAVAFMAARMLGKRLVKKEWKGQWSKVQQQLEERGFVYVVVLRLIPLFPFDLISYAAGASKVRLLPFVLGTLVGIIPGTFAYNFLGASLAEGRTGLILAAAAVLLIAIALPLLIKRKMNTAKDKRENPKEA
ncbi:TVP38/TMEM64 family protein [Paenibacillus sp. F411]|uniref:TVP38/TMEM64 family membrane protein n=1 Tax=Paenibacillus algicola TaxID=2565926 RepID=A0A4V1G3K9_9BACL|nr:MULTISPECIES: TVP38/TMEM64 family protein [Paenibacillus]MBO2945227.1 TVP38/TMEM64 family protein [Paenibacillus sp. F411]QCT01554.1 SNARE associated Golgi protein [Paenibacillus algicola]